MGSDGRVRYRNAETTLSMSAWSTHDIATRLAMLIRREDAGSREEAARRLRVSIDELERFLANEAGPPRPEFLAAIVRAYGTDACWLLTGERDIRSAHLGGAARVEVAELLLAVANVLLDPRWVRRTRLSPSDGVALPAEGSAELPRSQSGRPSRRDED